MLSTWSPDAVILDLGLPDGHGFDLLYQLRRDAPGLPVVLMSGASEELLIEGVAERGASDFVSKPVSPPVLLARISARLRERGLPVSRGGDAG